MDQQDVPLSVMVDLALSNAKSVRRDAGHVVRDLARIRDYLDNTNVQTEEVTTNERDTST